MFAFLLRLRDLAAQIGLPIGELFSLLQALWSLGAPPAISDEKALRVWMIGLSAVADKLTEITPTTLDDRLADFLSSVVATDKPWSIFYGLLTMLVPADDGTAITKAAASPEEFLVGATELSAELAGTPAALDPITIITLIQTVISLLKLWRK